MDNNNVQTSFNHEEFNQEIFDEEIIRSLSKIHCKIL